MIDSMPDFVILKRCPAGEIPPVDQANVLEHI
jgi:hypothetical protein